MEDSKRNQRSQNLFSQNHSADNRSIQRFFDQAPVCLFEVDREGRLLKINATACDAWGLHYPRNDAGLPPSFFALLDPDGHTLLRDTLSSANPCVTTTIPLQFEESQRWFDVTLSPHDPLEEGPLQFYGVAQDITERKDAEDRIRINEERLDQALAAGNDGLFDWDVNTNKVYFDARYYTMAGYFPDAFPHDFSEWVKRVHPDDFVGTEKSVQAFLRGDTTSYDEEFRFRRADDTWMWIRARIKIVSRDAHGNPQRIIGTHTNITRQKQAEAEVLEANERFNQLASTLQDVFWMTRADKQEMLYISPGYERLWGRPCETLYDTPSSWMDAIHPDDRDRVAQAADTHMATGEYDEEYRIVRPDGTIRWIHDRGYPIENIHGEIYRIAGIAEDITEQKRLEEELRRVQNLDALGLLAGGIAHDFNNVLTGVLGNLELLEDLLPPESETYELADEARVAANKTRGLIDQLMTFSKGSMPAKENVSLAELITETTTLCLRGANVKPTYILPPRLHAVSIDKGQIGQVIQNLVINALQAMPNGGVLKLSAENVDVTDEVIGLTPGPYVRVAIQDQGPGITAEDLPRIFDPYFTTKEMGHGLGLAIVYSIVGKHNGHIDARSEEGVGTTFEFYLPASSASAPSQRPHAATPPPGSGRILVMDDDDIVRRSIVRMLRHSGYDTEEVTDGEQALARYKDAMDTKNAFDAVIMDLTIPGGMGGKETVAHLRTIHPEARAIASSGYSHDPVMANFQHYDFDEAVRKPISRDRLIEALRQVLSSD